MQTAISFSFPFLLFCGLLMAQPYNVTIEKVVGYKGWTSDWDTVHVAKNSLVTLAVVPKLGGRVMQYDLGTNRSLFIKDSSLTPTSAYELVGGFRMLPSPQDDFGWPSPPNLDLNPYLCAVRSNTADSAVIYLESQIENSTEDKYQKHIGLQFKRLITLYKASTRVKIEMTMLNKGADSMTHGIWDITQTASANDSNSWVYFKRNPSSTLGDNQEGYVVYEGQGVADSQWVRSAAPDGIMGVRFLKTVGKIGADCKAGWICYNDRKTGYAYVKTFTYQEGKTYPDKGASVQVYTYESYDMLEVEVQGPLTMLAPGDSTKLVENWYATRSLGPVLDVNAAGLITNKLTAQLTADTVALTGTFGVFNPGAVKTQFCNATGAVIANADSTAVLPTDSLRVSKKLSVPAGAKSIRLAAFNAAGTLIGTLDSITVPNPAAVGRGNSANVIHRAKPLISRTAGHLTISVPFDGRFTTEIYSINGRRIASFSEKAPYRKMFDVKAFASNAIIVSIAGPGWIGNLMVLLPEGR